MSIDYRALCEELLNALTTTNPSAFGKFVALEDRARAALAAEPLVQGPTDEEVEAWAGDQGFIRGHGDHPCGFWIDDGDAGAFARAVLARYGHQPAPPVEGEVGELLRWLRRSAECADESRIAENLSRAADLLEQHAAGGWIVPSVEQRHPAPVPVAERLPGDELCWWFEADEDCGYGSNWTLLRIRGSATGYTHWLPATALPLPAGEVQP